MADYKQLFMSYMDAKGVKYQELDNNAVRVSYNADNAKSVTVFVIFDENGKNLAAFRSWDIAKFKDDKWVDGLTVCNTLNRKYRWAKFCLSEEGSLSAEDDAVLDEASCGEECMQLVQRMVNIVDEAYPTVMKAIWG